MCRWILWATAAVPPAETTSTRSREWTLRATGGGAGNRGRSQQAAKEGLSQMQQRFPFRLRELHRDNDSALVNDLLWDWTQQQNVRLSRSRPYKKNDNAWIE